MLRRFWKSFRQVGNTGQMADITPHLILAFNTADPLEKARITTQIFADLNAGQFDHADASHIPLRPGRPDKPELLAPRHVPKRRISSLPAGRIALLHALAHIELNAIDLSLDIAVRYHHYALPFDFIKDWLSVAADESRHFTLLSERLNQLGSFYGALPAHDGLWEAALKTADDLLGRLAIAPLVLEARGLDVTPQLIDKMQQVGDHLSADILQVIMRDEIGHVATGKKWFDFVAGCERLDPISSWQSLVKRYFNGALKPPFNVSARNAARFSSAFYGPLAAEQTETRNTD